MRKSPVFALLLLVGCASHSPVTLSYQGGMLQKVQVQPQSMGRSCFTIETSRSSVAITYAVDASSDWAGFRALESVLPGVVQAAVQGVALAMAPIRMIEELLGLSPKEQRPMQEPSAISACTAVLEDE